MILFLLAVYFSRFAFCYVNNIYGTPNVKTVLFTRHDAYDKNCWSRYETGLLFARYVMQDLLPRKVPGNVTYLEQYVTLGIRSIQETLVAEEGLEMMMHAFADTFGGYLRAYGLPLAKEAYYEGRLDIDAVSNLYRIQRKFKDYLKTDEEGWKEPMRVKTQLGPISPLRVHLDKSHDYCEDLILKASEKDDDNKETTSDSASSEYDCPEIPLPFFDDCKNPRAVAVPMKEQSLHSLSSNESEGVLSRYYEMSVNCIHQDTRCKREYKHCFLLFNQKFLKWVRKHLLCHLNDDRWYPAFYAVKRVVRAAEIAVDAGSTNSEGEEHEEISTLSFFMIVAFLLGLFWLIIVLCLLCRRCCAFKDDVNECRDNCEECCQIEGKTNAARLFTYNMSCWARTPRCDSATDWCECKELNYVEVERFEVEDEDRNDRSDRNDLKGGERFNRRSAMVREDDPSGTSDS